MFARKKKIMEAVNMIKTTSKASLKMSCLYLCNLDVAKAERMYDFLVKDMPDIPEVEPSQKTFLENFKEQAGGVMGWLRENQDMISQGVGFVKGIVSKKGAVPPLPPINE